MSCVKSRYIVQQAMGGIKWWVNPLSALALCDVVVCTGIVSVLVSLFSPIVGFSLPPKAHLVDTLGYIKPFAIGLRVSNRCAYKLRLPGFHVRRGGWVDRVATRAVLHIEEECCIPLITPPHTSLKVHRSKGKKIDCGYKGPLCGMKAFIA